MPSLSLEQVIAQNFPEESVIDTHLGSFTKFVTVSAGFPVSGFTTFGRKIFEGQQIVETDNYWFIDSRVQKISLKSILIVLAYVLVSSMFILWFAEDNIFEIPTLLFILFFLVVSIVIARVRHVFIISRGLSIDVYEKEWVSVSRKGKNLELTVTVPKYSRYTVGMYRYGSKLLDFLGLTISSAPLGFEYSLQCKDEEDKQ